MGFPVSLAGKELPAMQETPVQFLEEPLEKGQATLLPYSWASLVAQTVKNPPAMRETWVRSLGWEDPLEEGMATHLVILPGEPPRTEKPGRLQSWCCKELDMTEQQSTAQICPTRNTTQSPQLRMKRHYRVTQSQVKNSLLKISRTQRNERYAV